MSVGDYHTHTNTRYTTFYHLYHLSRIPWDHETFSYCVCVCVLVLGVVVYCIDFSMPRLCKFWKKIIIFFSSIFSIVFLLKHSTIFFPSFIFILSRIDLQKKIFSSIVFFSGVCARRLLRFNRVKQDKNKMITTTTKKGWRVHHFTFFQFFRLRGFQYKNYILDIFRKFHGKCLYFLFILLCDFKSC